VEVDPLSLSRSRRRRGIFTRVVVSQGEIEGLEPGIGPLMCSYAESARVLARSPHLGGAIRFSRRRDPRTSKSSVVRKEEGPFSFHAWPIFHLSTRGANAYRVTMGKKMMKGGMPSQKGNQKKKKKKMNPLCAHPNPPLVGR